MQVTWYSLAEAITHLKRDHMRLVASVPIQSFIPTAAGCPLCHPQRTLRKKANLCIATHSQGLLHPLLASAGSQLLNIHGLNNNISLHEDEFVSGCLIKLQTITLQMI